MGDPHSPLQRFLDELRRRRVTRVALVYLLIAWVVIQAAETLFPLLLLPEWTMRAVVAAAILGFPAALGLAWAFDVTSEGVRRTPPRATSEGAAVSGATPSRFGRFGALALVAVLVGVAGYQYFGARGEPAGAEAEAIRSIAVLPFVNMSERSEDEHFSDGITEELLNVLAQIPGLQVAARTSSFQFKGKNLDISEVAERLGVQAVLEGSVRREGERVRITAQLIDASSGFHLWSDRYDRELASVFAVQDEISRAIVDALKVRLAGSAPSARTGSTGSVEAHDLYLLGLHHWHRRTRADLERALEYFRRAAAADPEYPKAHAGIALTWAVLPGHTAAYSFERARTEGRAAAERALELEPGLAEAHAALGQIAQQLEWDLAAAERHYRRALELNPSYATGHQWLAETLAARGDFEASLAEGRRAVELDPLAPTPMAIVAYALYSLGRDAEAEAEFARVLRVAPGFVPGLLHQGAIMAHSGRTEEAARAWRRLAIEMGADSTVLVRVARAMADPALRPAALEGLRGETGLLPTMTALFAAELDDPDLAVRALERGVELQADVFIPFMPTHRAFERMRDHPGFRAVAARIGAP